MTITTQSPRRNGVDVATLFATLDAVKGQPEIAKFQFRATQHLAAAPTAGREIYGFYGAMQEMAHKHGHRVDADHPAVLVGTDHAPTPVEYLLHALAACLTAGIANIAAARGVNLTEVSSTVEGDIDLLGILGPLRRLGPQRLPADPGHLPHRGRRRRRDAARDRRAVPPPLRRLRRADQPHPRPRRRRRPAATRRPGARAAGRPGRPAGRAGPHQEGTTMNTIDTVVIGAGHAGLAVSHLLGRGRARPRRPRPRPGRRALAHRALGLAAPAHPELDDPAPRLALRRPRLRTASCPPASSSATSSGTPPRRRAPLVLGRRGARGRARTGDGYRVVTDGAAWQAPPRRDRHRRRPGGPASRRGWSGLDPRRPACCRGGLPQPRPAAGRRRAGRRRLGVRAPRSPTSWPGRPPRRPGRRAATPDAAPLPRHGHLLVAGADRSAWPAPSTAPGAARPRTSRRSSSSGASRSDPRGADLDLARCRPRASSWPDGCARSTVTEVALRRRPGRATVPQPTTGWPGSSTTSTAHRRRRPGRRGRAGRPARDRVRRRAPPSRLPTSAPRASARCCWPPATGRTTRGCGCRSPAPDGHDPAGPRRHPGARACTSSGSGSSTAATRRSSTVPGTTPATWSTTCARDGSRPRDVLERRRHERLRRRRRRRPGGRCLDRAAARPGRRPGRAPRAVGVRQRHAVDPRPDAGRRAAAEPLGPARPGRRRGHAAGPHDDVPLRRRRAAAGVDPAAAPGSTRCTPRGGTCSTGSSSTRRPRPAPSVRHGTRVTGLLRDRTGRVAGVRSRTRRDGAATLSRARSSWARTGSPRPWPGEAGAPVLRRGPLRRARCGTPTSTGLDAHRLRVGLPRRRRGRPDPDQRRADLRVRRDHPGADAHAADGAGRPRTRFDARVRLAAPRTATGSGPRTPGRAGFHGWAGRRGFVRRSWGPGLGAGRRRGLLQGPDQHARDDRRAARRRAARVRGPGRPRRATGTEAAALDGYQRRRDLLSAQLFQVSDEIAGLRLGRRPGAAAAAEGQRGDDRRGRDARGAAPGRRTGRSRPVPVRGNVDCSAADHRSRQAHGRHHHVARGLLGRRRARPGGRPRRGAGAARRPWSSCWRWPRAAGCTANRSSTRCGPTCRSSRDAPAAQGRPLRASRARRRDRGPGAAQRPRDALPGRRRPRRRRRVPAGRRGGGGAGSAAEAELALAGYAGPLLPDDLYEPWASPWRETLGVLHRDLLRLAGRWEELVRVEPRRRGGPPGAGARPRRAGRRTRGAAPARADGAGAAAGAGHRAQRRGDGTARPPLGRDRAARAEVRAG